jgi:hypothetical protein
LLSFLIFTAVAAPPLVAQGPSSIVGIIARYGWGPTTRTDDAFGVGLELEAFPTRTVVPGFRLDHWDFGIDCGGLGPCPSGVTTVALGAKYRVAGATRMVPYAGGDVGYMSWTSDVTGVSLRARAGADIRLVRHVDLNVDGSFTRFVERSDNSGSMLEEQLWGFSAGLKLWL